MPVLPNQKVWSPYPSLLPRLQVAKMLQGSPPPKKGTCGDGASRMPSTRDDEKKIREIKLPVKKALLFLTITLFFPSSRELGILLAPSPHVPFFGGGDP